MISNKNALIKAAFRVLCFSSKRSDLNDPIIIFFVICIERFQKSYFEYVTDKVTYTFEKNIVELLNCQLLIYIDRSVDEHYFLIVSRFWQNEL